MNTTYLIAIIRNAVIAKKTKITVSASKKFIDFLDLLVQNRYIIGYSRTSHGKINIFLDFTYNKNKILSLKHISKPSKSTYISNQDLWKFDRSLGLLILSTSKGLISHKTALIKGLGGKVICFIL